MTDREIELAEDHEWHDDRFDMRGNALNVDCPHCWPHLRNAQRAGQQPIGFVTFQE